MTRISELESPINSGNLYHSYKGLFSLVLLAVCDTDYCFRIFDVGEYGSNSDSDVLTNPNVRKRFEREALSLNLCMVVSFLHFHISFWVSKYFL